MVDRLSRRQALKGLGVAGLAGVAGCSGDGGSGSGSGSDGGSGSGGSSSEYDYTVGFQVGGMGNSWFTALAKAAQWYGEDHGIQVNIGDGELNPTTQVKVARNLINSGVDALVVDPFDGEAMANVVDEAVEQDIPVFAADAAPASGKIKLYTAFGNFNAGYRAAKSAIERLPTEGGEPTGNLAAVMIEQSVHLGRARHNGTKAAIEEHDNVNLIGEILTNNTRTEASEKVFNFLQQNADTVDGFVPHAVTTGNGTLNALDRNDMKVAQDAEGHVIVSQIDAGASTLEAISNGYVDTAIDQPVHFYGPITLHYVKEYLDAGKDDSALPSIGDTVEQSAFDLESETMMEQAGQDIWKEPVWAPGEVQDADWIDAEVPWLQTRAVKVTEENADASYLWGNWIKEVA